VTRRIWRWPTGPDTFQKFTRAQASVCSGDGVAASSVGVVQAARGQPAPYLKAIVKTAPCGTSMSWVVRPSLAASARLPNQSPTT